MKKETLESFVKYCEENPEQRFWQALRNWSNEYYYHRKPVVRSIELETLNQDNEIYRIDTWELE